MSANKWSKLKFGDDDDEGDWTPVRAPAPVSATTLVPVHAPVPTGRVIPDDEPIEAMADMPIPTGNWTIYYHAHYNKERDFSSIDKFKLGKTISTFGQFWAMWDAIGDETIMDGYFYLMRDDYPPIWEDSKNIEGGTYTIRIEKDRERTPVKLYYTYAIAAMLGQLAIDPENIITGVRISNKPKHNLIHIWNKKSEGFNNPSDIKLYHTPNPGNEVRYERVCEKRF